MSSNLKLLRRFFEYLDAAGNGSIGVRELEEPLISVVGSQSGAGCVGVSHISAGLREGKADVWLPFLGTGAGKRGGVGKRALLNTMFIAVCVCLFCAGLGCVTR
jgi:hypothetical protein